MTGLYPLSLHDSPLREISMLPGALPKPSDERAAIARLDAAGVRLVITDRRDWAVYGQGSFGETFDRILDNWIRQNFEHTSTISVPGLVTRTLDVWTRRAP
jgi:hypothetical protein